MFSYSGVAERWSRPSRARLEEELHRVVIASQLWQGRPATRGGGGTSFDSLDFHRLGLSADPGALEWRGKDGSYRIIVRSPDHFILEVRELSGKVAALDTIEFDTMPTLPE